MSTSVLVAKERQPSSPSGLWQKQAKNKKNTAQTRHSCTLFDVLSIFVECSATRRRSTRSRLGFRALLQCAVLLSPQSTRELQTSYN